MSRDDRSLTHAGGLVRRFDGGSLRVLLVRAMRTEDWVLPKGHIETGESFEETAVREVREEAGVEAAPLRYLGSLVFTSPRGELVRAGFFLMEFIREVPRTEAREVRWCAIPEALALCRFEDTCALIRQAGTG